MAGSRKYLQSLLLLAIPLCPGVVKSQDEVVVSQGKIRGITLTSRNGRNFSAFLGIPYAQPPIGLLRFKNPLPADSWNGTFVADTDGNLCPQHDDDDVLVGYEDCLYLNVFTPKSNSSIYYPTMVYIHGGAFIKGGTKYASPGYIMDKDIVYVALNYRLGVLGFLSTGDAEAPGNFGLKDQVLALRWVQENIRAFGGDPNRVTLFGQSAGSVSVNLHVLSDASNGLFHQYIAQSGSSLCFWAYHDISDYKKRAKDLGEYVNCPSNDSRVLIDCLRKIDAYTLVDSNDIFNGLTNFINTWVPTNEPEFGGAFLTASPISRLLKNKMKDLPFITGAVANEGLAVTTRIYANETLYNMITSDLENFLTRTATFIDIEDPIDLVSSVKMFYFKGIEPNDKDAFFRGLTNLMSDVGFLFPLIVQMQIALERTKNPFYFYSFEYRGTYSDTLKIIGIDNNIGVTHNDDLIYIFPTSPENLGVTAIKFNQSDENMIDVTIDLWTSFAYTGTPTSNRIAYSHIWQPYNDDMSYLRIGEKSDPTVTRHSHYHEDRMHFWAMQLLKMALHIG